MPHHGRQFTVLWRARSRDQRSAVMTEAEAEKLAARLRNENVDGVKILKGLDGPLAHRVGRG